MSHLSSSGIERTQYPYPVRAAAYVRMSTEHQQYSTENQASALFQYAQQRNIDIVRTYADEGKSGLRLDGRDALKNLLEDVESGHADYSTILVYDVSRWGRFQDPDESASYEIRCKHAGVSVQYCAEQFVNDGSPVSSIIKSVKRTMAGEYSRELSVKVFAGQARLIERGYRQGGPSGYGLRRQLVDHTGAPKALLTRGEHKSIQTDRIVLIPGPPEEVAIVGDIYRAFVEEGRSEREIASMLNQQGIKTDLERGWTRGTVHQVLINEKYIGNNVWNHGSFKLKNQRVRNSPDQWVRADGVFESIVNKTLFDAAQAIILSRSYRLSDEEMLEALRQLYRQQGYLSGLVIDEAENCLSSSAYQNRFGSLLRSYALIDYTPDRDYSYIEINRSLREHYPHLVEETIDHIESLGGRVWKDPDNDLLTLNEEFTVSLVLSRCRETQAGSHRWIIRFDTGLFPDITVAVRMSPDGTEALGYYLLPVIDMTQPKLTLAQQNEVGLEIYRFDTLEPLFALARRTSLREMLS